MSSEQENTPVDAKFSIVITPDGMNAHLTLLPAQDGGKPVGDKAILGRLKELGVVSAEVDTEAIKAVVDAGSGDNVLIAQGKHAQNGKDGWFECLLSFASSRIPQESDDGRIDYLDLGEMPSVQKGDVLMRCHKPEMGQDGMTLFGKVVAAKEGRAVVFAPNLAGTEVSSEDSNLLLAAVSGFPVEVNGGMTVEPVYKVKRVNVATGHIRFDGTVEVVGDISAGMCVEATGDILVGGTVEPATLKAGGNITIKGGVLGVHAKQAGASSCIECDGSFSAVYAQQAQIKAGDTIFIDDLAMQCELEAGNRISIGSKRRGVVIGGCLSAATSITGKVFGSDDQVRTILKIGANPELYQERIALKKSRSDKENQVLEISKLLAVAQKNPGKIKPAMLDKARSTNAALLDEITLLRQQQEAVEEKIKIVEQSQIIVQERAYSGVEVCMGEQRFQLPGNCAACTIGLTENGLGILEE